MTVVILIKKADYLAQYSLYAAVFITCTLKRSIAIQRKNWADKLYNLFMVDSLSEQSPPNVMNTMFIWSKVQQSCNEKTHTQHKQR